MLRSAAKNFESVAVVTEPERYDAILEEMRANDGATTRETRVALALKVFQTTNAYDGAIARWLGGQLGEQAELHPAQRDLHLVKQQDLRYGENPHQAAMYYRKAAGPALRREPAPGRHVLPHARVRHRALPGQRRAAQR